MPILLNELNGYRDASPIAALHASDKVCEDRHPELATIVSVTFDDRLGRPSTGAIVIVDSHRAATI